MAFHCQYFFFLFVPTKEPGTSEFFQDFLIVMERTVFSVKLLPKANTSIGFGYLLILTSDSGNIQFPVVTMSIAKSFF